MNDNKPLIETSETLETTSVEPSVEASLALEPQIDEAPNQSFTCECKEWMRSACTGLPYYAEHEGKQYCVLHYPPKEQVHDFRVAFDKKLSDEDFDFSGVYFPEEVNFNSLEFKNAANFSGATFSAQANFGGATFNAGAHFRDAIFNTEANFDNAKFNAEATFGSAQFYADIYFDEATFSDTVSFRYTRFKDVYFRESIFKDYVWFSEKDTFSSQSSLNLEHARIEKPERVSFHTLTLQPHWFINVDAQKFVFTSVDWIWEKNVSLELEKIEDEDVLLRNRLCSIAWRYLALNAEENHRYEEASKFRYFAMEAQRLQGFRPSEILLWAYWLFSGYGERIRNAVIWLIVILCGFAFLYLWVGFEKPIESYWSSLLYSLNVAALQKPEPEAITSWAKFLVAAETILGPLQAALLALAIRRKFMR